MRAILFLSLFLLFSFVTKGQKRVYDAYHWDYGGGDLRPRLFRMEVSDRVNNFENLGGNINPKGTYFTVYTTQDIDNIVGPGGSRITALNSALGESLVRIIALEKKVDSLSKALTKTAVIAKQPKPSATKKKE